MYRQLEHDSYISRWRDAERELAIKGLLVQPSLRVDTPQYYPPLPDPRGIDPIDPTSGPDRRPTNDKTTPA